MKRKLALFLAVAMTLAMLPMNLFATSTNGLSKSVISVNGKAAYLESGQLSRLSLGNGQMADAADSNSDIDYLVDGTYLQFRPSNDVASGTSLILTLTNGKWHFDSAKAPEVTSKVSTGTGYNEVYGDYSNSTYTRYGYVLDESGKNYLSMTGTTDGYPTYTLVPTSTVTKLERDVNAMPIYSLAVSGADATRATLKFLTPIYAYESSNTTFSLVDADKSLKGYVRVPLVVRSTSDSEDIKIGVGSNTTTLSGGTWVFGSTSDSNTTTYVDDYKTARDDFYMPKLVIKEEQIGSMENGTVRISLPSGFEFNDNMLSKLKVYAENFGYGSAGQAVKIFDATDAASLENANIKLAWKQSGKEDDYQAFEITFMTLNANKSDSLEGIIYITDGDSTNKYFSFNAEESASFGDINMSIKNVSGGSVVTNESFIGGVRKDWTVTLETTSSITTLVNGRYEDYDAVDAEDDIHMAASLKFKENVADSWFAQRSTTFTLPEGVKYRKVEVTDTDKITTGATLEDGPSTYGGYYVNSNKKVNGVTIDGNVMTWNGLAVTGTTDKGVIEFDVWLSVESGFEGDITMLVGGSAVVDETQEPVVIAKAVSPIEVATSVTDIQVGYQTYAVADIEITETAAGMLEKNKEVWLTISDGIYEDVYFSPGFEYEVTDGNIKIEDVGIATGSNITVSGNKIKYNDNYGLGSGTISFDVASESSTASTIKFSNLMLKINRTVPQSSVGYKVYAWGPNIAPNSKVFDYSGVLDTAYEGNDQHNLMGISAAYLKVVTPASGESTFSSVVKVTAGSSTAYVSGNAVTVDPAPYIDVATSRMQVPVRAVATLLGVTESQILWSDSARTVTINMPNRTIQFTIGSDVMVINGAQVTMDTEAMIQASSGRTFIPFRYLGDALGVAVGYDDSTKTATYNSDLDDATVTPAVAPAVAPAVTE